MNRLPLVGLIVTLALACLGAAERPWPERPRAGWSTDANVVRVIDGDTLVVEVRRSVHVRLLGCWAPESRTRDPAEKKLGLAAKANLQALCPPGQKLRLLIPAGDGGDISAAFTMGRVLAYGWREGDTASLQEQQVSGGFARRDDPSGRHHEPEPE